MDSRLDLTKLLAPFDVATLDRKTSAVYALTVDLRLAYMNPASNGFSVTSGRRCSDKGLRIGSRLLDFIPASKRASYARLFDRARARRVVADHVYVCSSARTFRSFRMRVHPCNAGGIIIETILLRVFDYDAAATRATDAAYRSVDGVIVQCSHCLRVRRVGGRLSWEWVAHYLASPPDGISHGICGACLEFHYPPEP